MHFAGYFTKERVEVTLHKIIFQIDCPVSQYYTDRTVTKFVIFLCICKYVNKFIMKPRMQ